VFCYDLNYPLFIEDAVVNDMHEFSPLNYYKNSHCIKKNNQLFTPWEQTRVTLKKRNRKF